MKTLGIICAILLCSVCVGVLICIILENTDILVKRKKEPKGEKKMKKSEQIKRLESRIEELKERMDAMDFMERNKQGFRILIVPTCNTYLFTRIVKTTYEIQFVNEAKVRSVEVFDEEATFEEPIGKGKVDVVENANEYFVVRYDRENEALRYFYIDKNACTSTEITGAYTEKK